MKRSTDKKLSVRKQTLRTLSSTDLRRVAGGMIPAEGSGDGTEQAMVFPICTDGQIGMDRDACGGDILGVVIG